VVHKFVAMSQKFTQIFYLPLKHKNQYKNPLAVVSDSRLPLKLLSGYPLVDLDDFQFKRLNIKGVDAANPLLITLNPNLLKWKSS